MSFPITDLVIHSENAVATRLHASLSTHEIEELQFHWEEIKYEWEDLLEAYQEHQLPEQEQEQDSNNKNNSKGKNSDGAASSSLLYPAEEIARWKRYREAVVERLGDIDKLLEPIADGDAGGGNSAGAGISGNGDGNGSGDLEANTGLSTGAN